MADKQDDVRTLNLYQKLAAITGEIGSVAKDGRNSEQKFDFIEYAAVAGKLRTLFSKYEVVVIPRMQEAKKQDRREIVSKYGAKGTYALIDFYYEVVNASKPDERFTVRWTGEASDYGDKAANKAATGALKYYLMRQFNISEKGDDPDEHSPEAVSAAPIPKAQAPKRAAPAPPPAPAAVEVPTRKHIPASQVGFLLSRARTFSGLEDRDEIVAWFTEKIGVPATEVFTDEYDDVMKALDAFKPAAPAEGMEAPDA
jgi:hypothetical protein